LNLFGKCRNGFHKKIKETFKNKKNKTRVSHDFNTKTAYISDLKLKKKFHFGYMSLLVPFNSFYLGNLRS